MRSILTRSVVLVLGITGAPARGQSSSVHAANLAGCYTLTRGAWSRPFGDSTFHKMPPVVSLDSAAASPSGGWQLRPDIPHPFGRRFPGTPKWTLRGDTVMLMWSDGFTPTRVALTRRTDGSLSGRAVALSDAHDEREPPPPDADVILRRTTCPEGFDEPLTRALVKVPPGLDSAAAEQWVATRQRACRGRFMRVYDEMMVSNTPPDSVPSFRYARALAGAQCLPGK